MIPWPWRRRLVSKDEHAAREAAEATVTRQTRETAALGAALREVQRRNHLGENAHRALRGW